MKPVHSVILFFTNYLFLLLVFTSLPVFIIVKLLVKRNGVLFLENFPQENAGYHYRSMKWAEIMRSKGYRVKIKTVINDRKRFETTSNFFFLWISYFKKYFHIAGSVTYKTIIVRREILAANDYGYLFMERFLLALHPDAILDFDDDIAFAKNQPKNKLSFFGKIMLEHPDKFNATLKLFRKFIVGSPFLSNLITTADSGMKQKEICYIPTCVNYDEVEPKKQFFEDDTIVFGWIGGIYNLYLLESMLPALERIAGKQKLKLLVIAGTKPKWKTSVTIEFLQWNLNKEVEYLKRIDIGLMPLQNNVESIGKCGFKLIQYMGLGIPSIAAGIGINKLIVEHGINGYLVEPDCEWYEVLKDVVNDKEKLPAMGIKARKTILDGYTFNANKEKYIQFITS